MSADDRQLHVDAQLSQVIEGPIIGGLGTIGCYRTRVFCISALLSGKFLPSTEPMHEDSMCPYNLDCECRGSEISSSIALHLEWQCKHILVTGDLYAHAWPKDRLPDHPRRNGWFNASLGVILRLGSKARHLSSRSMKLVITFTSSSCNLADIGGMRRVLRSREGLEMCTCLTTSYV